jgi:hypothetical protein
MSTPSLEAFHFPADPGGQRQDERYAYRLPVTLLRRGEEIPLVTEDVSYHGLFLETDDPLPLRYIFRLKLFLPPFDRELDALGMAVHQVSPREAMGRTPGVGVQLYAMDHAARTVWSNFVARVSAGELGSGRREWAAVLDGALLGIRFLEPEILDV